MITKIAENLGEVYTNFDPFAPLSTLSELRDFYVIRKKSPLERMKMELLYDNTGNMKSLFSGHRGSGKSTELNKLVSDELIQSKYFVVKYSVKEVLDIAGLDYIDLLVSIGAQIFIKATEDGKLKLNKGVLDELERWLGTIEIVREDTSLKSASVEAEAGLKAVFIKLLGKLKVEYTTRDNIRQTIQPKISELIGIINLIINELVLNLNKKVLVVIEDLDKPDLKIAEELLYKRQTSLTSPSCCIIYTVPIGLLYCPDAPQVGQAFNRIYVLPNVSITKRDDLSPNPDGQETMRKFIEKRMSLDLIEENALKHAITISGGVFREMARIIRTSTINAIGRDAEIISLDDVEMVESEIRNEYRRILETQDYEALKVIHETRELKGSEICAKLLHELSILEYQNDDNWCDVHPTIIPLIEPKKKGRVNS